MAAKLHINLGEGLIEVEGEEAFVKFVYEDVKAAGLLTKPSSFTPTSETIDDEVGAAEKPAKARRSVPKRSGPSCASRITELKDEGLFSDLRDTKAIGAALAAKGHNYEGKHISAALINLTQNGTLRRVKRDGVWMYQNP